DLIVTGVQTCALPILRNHSRAHHRQKTKSRKHIKTARQPMPRLPLINSQNPRSKKALAIAPRRAKVLSDRSRNTLRSSLSLPRRSEERRVGKECKNRR